MYLFKNDSYWYPVSGKLQQGKVQSEKVYSLGFKCVGYLSEFDFPG